MAGREKKMEKPPLLEVFLELKLVLGTGSEHEAQGMTVVDSVL